MRRSVLEFWKRKSLDSLYGSLLSTEGDSAGPHPTPGRPQIAKRRLLLERLEERLLFDAGPQAPTDVDVQAANDQLMESASVADVLDSRLIEPVDARPAMTASDAANSANAPSNSSSPQLTQPDAVPVLNPNADDSASVGSLLNTDAVAAELLTTVDEQRSELRAATVDLRHELIFVDPTLTNADELVAGLLKSADNSRSFEVVMLDATKRWHHANQRDTGGTQRHRRGPLGNSRFGVGHQVGINVVERRESGQSRW